MIIFFITSILGLIRDFIKYKNISFKKFIRTPILTIIFYYILSFTNISNPIFLAIILERWFFLILKSFISCFNNDYLNKKEKYKIKYNLIYKN